MKRLVLLLCMVLMLSLAACDTMGPATQEVIPTDVAPAATDESQPAPEATSETTGEQPEDTTAQPGADLLGVTWEWVSLLDPMGQTTATDPTRYTILFNTDGTASVRADCNNVVANYFTDGVNLVIEPGASTMAACPEDTQDQLFLNSLAAAESYLVQDGELFITMTGESGTIIFRSGTSTAGEASEPGADPVLTGVTWEWTEVVTMVGTTAVVDPTRYTILFNEDGTANIKADCNNVQATYTSDDTGALTLTPGPSTLAACPPDSQVNEFMAGLQVTGAYQFDGADLLLRNIAADGGVMRFRAAGSETTTPVDTLTGVTWEWTETVNMLGATATADPTRYTILFNEDGTANIKADCNNVLGTYTSDDTGAFTLTLGPSTLVACPPDSQVNEFMAGLQSLALGVYQFVDGNLLLSNTAADGVVMHFRAAGGGDTGSGPVDDTLTNIVWEWVSTTSTTGEVLATDPTKYTIIFNADGTAGIKADCNVGNAEYTIGEDGSMTITLGISTMAFCVDSQDTMFREGLAAAALYYLDAGDLFIEQAGGAGTMRFRNGGAADAETPPPATETLTGVTWEWVKTVTPVEEIVVADQTRYNIVFNEDGTANIKADCNVGTATYSTGEGSTISILPGAMTLAMCPEDSQATQFMAGLSAAAIYFFQDGNLFIDMTASSGTMQFAAAGTAGSSEPGKGEVEIPPAASGELVGTLWQLTLISKTDGNITVNDPSRYTLTFNADSTLNYQADCNVGGGTYATGEGGALTITLGPTTLAYCGAGSLDQIYIGGLTNAMSYRIEEGNLVIDMLYESGSLVFAPGA